MSNKKKIYQNVEGLAFIYKKNAKAEKTDFKQVEISMEEFKKAMDEDTFMDAKDFLKNNPSFLIIENFDGITDIDVVEQEEQKEKKSNTDILRKAVEELQKRLEVVETENKELKNGKLKLKFEEVQELVEHKAELLQQLAIYTEKKGEFEELLTETEKDENILERNDMALIFEQGANEYRREKILRTSSHLIISEFLPFIIIKLSQKIIALKEEIQAISI